MAEKGLEQGVLNRPGEKISKQKESCSNGSRERGFFFFAKHGGGMEIEQHRQGRKIKKKANSEMKGVCKEEDVGGTEERGKRTERERERLNSSGK